MIQQFALIGIYKVTETRHLLTRPLVNRHILRIVWRAFLEYLGQLSLKIAVVAGLHREFLNEDGEVAAQICPEDVGLLMAGLICSYIFKARGPSTRANGEGVSHVFANYYR